MTGKKTLIILFSLLLFLVLAYGVYFAVSKLRRDSSMPKSEVNSSYNLVIKEGQVSYNCPKGMSVFEGLVKNIKDVKFVKTSYGNLVISINGKEQNKGKSWIFTVNSKSASDSANSYICRRNEKIDWQFK